MNHHFIPRQQGFRMPAEWNHHSGTLLSWPQNEETWPGERLDRVEKVYVQIVQALLGREQIHLILSDDETRRRAFKSLKEAGINPEKLHIHNIPGNDVWARDFGPIFLLNDPDGGDSAAKKTINPTSNGLHKSASEPQVMLLNWNYNAWGGKYPPFDADDAVPAYFSQKFNIPMASPGIVLEGGSIETNGAGVLLTTESVLLNPNRNPHLSKTEIEEYLVDYLGHEKVIWLKNGLAGDDTDGHIDDLSRFLNERVILTMMTEDKSDVNYFTLQENFDILKSSTDLNGKPFEIVTLPMPETTIEGTTVDGSEHVPASYGNFYLANGAVLLPLYDPRYDEMAASLFRRYFPDREVIGIPCQDLVWGQGSIHCITQQLYGLP